MRPRRTQISAISAAGQAGATTAEAHALLRKSFVALYGEHDPQRGLSLAEQAAGLTASGASRTLAGLALLHGGGDYLVLHNIACVYARLSQTDAARAVECEDLTIDHLRRAVELWRKGGSGPDELQLIQDESAFHARLRARPEFQQLLRPPAP